MQQFVVVLPQQQRRTHSNACAALQTFQTKDYPTFPDAVNALTHLPGFHENSPRSAAFAVAGPVSANRCEMTNLSWVIDGVALTQKYGVRCAAAFVSLRQLNGILLTRDYRVAVLNDFEANGYGILALQPEDVAVLHDAPATPKVSSSKLYSRGL